MSSRLIALVVVTAGFFVLTVLALLEVGYFGIFEPHFLSWGGAQVFVDLVIALSLFLIWMVFDAREREISVWPFVLITLTMGSFGPLLYLLVREWRATETHPVSAA